MKLTPAQIESFIKRPAETVVGCLVYGPDQGLVQERSRSLLKTILPDAGSFQLVELTMTELKNRPALFQDELRTIPFGGGRRVVWVQDATDGLTKEWKEILEQQCWGGFVLISADELGPRSSLRLLSESHQQVATIACYNDQPQDIANLIQTMVRASQKSMTPDALRWLQNHLGNDRLLTRQELEKLLLYKGDGQDIIDLDDVQTVVSDVKQLGMDMLCHAVAERRLVEALPIYQDLIVNEEEPIALVRSLSRHFNRLLQVKTLMQQGKAVEQALQALQPPLFFRDKPRFVKQLQLWTIDQLMDFLQTCQTTEWSCKQTGSLPPAILGQGLIHTLATE